MDGSLKSFENIQRELRKELEDLSDEMIFSEEDWKKETNELKKTTEKEINELKERIEKLEMRWMDYNKNGQNNIRQLEQENNTRNTSSFTSISSTFSSQSVQPTSDNARHMQCNNNVNYLMAKTSDTSGNGQCQNSHISKQNESNKLNVTNTVSNIRENDAFRVTSDDVNRSENKSNQSASENSRNVNNTDDDSAKIMCYCHKPAMQLVEKMGLHKGRRYYKCANSNKSLGSRCAFVWWATDSAESQSNATNENSSSMSKNINKLKKLNQSAPENSHNVNNTDDDNAKIMCYCQNPAIRLVKNEGRHKGRVHYKCAKLRGCKFVLSVSDSAESQLDNATNEYSSLVSNMMVNAGAGTSNNNSVMVEVDSHENTNCWSNSNFGASKKPKIESKRKCGFCKIEGHTITTCRLRSNMIEQGKL